MGIFSNKQSDAVYQDDMSQAAQPVQQVQPASTDGILPAQDSPVQPASSFMNQSAPPMDDTSNGAGDYIMTDPPVPASPVQDDLPMAPAEPNTELPEPETVAPEPAPASVEQPAPPEPTHVSVSTDSSDLDSIKQDALKQLSPLVPHLDQSPEERFHTIMMMMQATDDRTLVKPAYEAAQSITDEKTKAQALLDIVNEINYFTQDKS